MFSELNLIFQFVFNFKSFSTFGVRYKSYCSNIARTFLVDPSEKIQAMYELLVDAEEHILSELKDGAKMSDVYNSTIEMVKKEKPELVIFHFNPSGYSGSVG